MPGARQPIRLIVEKGNSHFTKEQIAERLASEPQPCTDEIVAPAFLTAPQKKQFYKIAEQLQKINLIGETDCETLARYISAEALYEAAVKDLRKLAKDQPKEEKCLDQEGYYALLDLWTAAVERADKRQDRYFRQAQTAAAALGLTISSRCKLQVPVHDEEPRVNKFSHFGKAAGGA